LNIKFRVELSQSERDQLDALLSGGRHANFSARGAFSLKYFHGFESKGIARCNAKNPKDELEIWPMWLRRNMRRSRLK
jgi:hypothetical protein